jgi:hypothetical protein
MLRKLLTSILLTTLAFTAYCNKTYFENDSSTISSIHYSLDSCEAYVIAGTIRDYSEFTAITNGLLDCGSIMPLGNVYRLNPNVNTHSCTNGVNGQLGMCISSVESCSFIDNDDKALRFDILINPNPDEILQLRAVSLSSSRLLKNMFG